MWWLLAIIAGIAWLFGRGGGLAATDAFLSSGTVAGGTQLCTGPGCETLPPVTQSGSPLSGDPMAGGQFNPSGVVITRPVGIPATATSGAATPPSAGGGFGGFTDPGGGGFDGGGDLIL